MDELDVALRNKEEEIVFEGTIFDSSLVVPAGLGDELSKKENSHVKILSLRACTVTKEATVGLVQLLQQNTSLRVLNLDCLYFVERSSPVMIINALEKNVGLEKLEFFNLGLTSVDHLTGLLGIVQHHKTLVDLSIDTDDLGDSAAVALLAAAVQQKRITKLNLSKTGMSFACVPKLCELLEQNSTIQSLGLSTNCFRANGGSLLAKVLKSDSVLVELSLETCGLLDEGVASIAHALHFNKTLKTLYIGFNKFHEKGATALGELLAANSCLTNLGLDSNKIMAQGCLAICDGLKRNNSLRSLSLVNCLLNESMFFLGDLLRCTKSLTCLKADSEAVALDGLWAFFRGLAENKSLRVLELDFASYGREALLAEMMKNGSVIQYRRHDDLGRRNRKMLARARDATMALLFIRWSGKEKTLLHLLPKDVVRLIAKIVWNSRTEVATWAWD